MLEQLAKRSIKSSVRLSSVCPTDARDAQQINSPITAVVIYVVAMCSYISGEVHVRLLCTVRGDSLDSEAQ